MSALEIRVHGRTHVGHKRETNEDALLLDADCGLYAVLDGMGGTQAGEVASSRARDVIREYVRAKYKIMAPAQCLEGAIQAASAAVHAEAARRRDRRGMGTTVVAALVLDERHVVIAHVGDSRAYLLRDGQMRLLTRDHTVVAELLAKNAITAEEAVHHPYKSVLSRNLGAKPRTKVDITEVELHPGDRLLLCSDGLHGFAVGEAVEHTLSGTDDPKRTTQDLIDLALRGGGGDNISVVVVEAGTAEVPRATQIVRTSGAAAWWSRREIFLARARALGLEESPIFSVLSPDEAVQIVAGNLYEAVFHDLEQTTGIHVWTFTENLANGWFDQGGDYASLRQVLDLLRTAADAVLEDVHADSAPFAINLEIAVMRALVVAEMALGGILANRIRAIEADLVRSYARAAQPSLPVPDRRPETFADQPTMPFMEAVRIDPPTPAVSACLEAALARAQQRISVAGERPVALECLARIHRAALDPAGPTENVLGSRELYGVRPVEEGSVAPLFDALDLVRASYAQAIKEQSVEAEVKAAALRRASVAQRALVFGVAGLAVEAGYPISERLQAAVDETARLRGALSEGEARIAELERDGGAPARRVP